MPAGVREKGERVDDSTGLRAGAADGHQLEPVHAVFWYAPEVFGEAAALGYEVKTRWPSYSGHHRPRGGLRDDRQGQHADAVPAAQEVALGSYPRRFLREHGPRPPGSPHDQGRPGPGLDGFAGAAQVAQVRRTVTKKGKKTVEVVYLITSDRGVEPAILAAWVRGHWEIENKLHWVRDVTYQEDRSLVRTGNAPRVMATLRSLAISLLHLDGHASIAAANRHHARDPQRTLTLLQTA